MREYFTRLLNNLESLTGMKQLERISQKHNAADELNNLLDILCRVSDLFPYIPDDAKKNIISDSVVTDQDFIGLNAKIIYKWLNLRKDIYFKEVAHQHRITEEDYAPAVGEKREEWLKIWTQELDKMSDNFTVKPVTNAELMREKMLGEEATPTHYRQDEEKAKAKIVHIEYVKANYDTVTKNALETWLPEDEWIRKNYGTNEPLEQKEDTKLENI